MIGNWTSEYFSFIQFFVVVFLTKDIFVLAELPPPVMIEATHKLIAYSVTSGHLHRNYTLLGHRQVRTTECPGERLFEEIATWPHFSATVPAI